MALAIPQAKILEAVRKYPGNRVKVAVADIDGVLRGKYLHKDKFFSAAEGGFFIDASSQIANIHLRRSVRDL